MRQLTEEDASHYFTSLEQKYLSMLYEYSYLTKSLFNFV